MSLYLSSNQFFDYIHEVCPKLRGQRPNFFKLDNNRKAEAISIVSPTCIKNLNYFGVLIITTMTDIPKDVSHNSRSQTFHQF